MYIKSLIVIIIIIIYFVKCFSSSSSSCAYSYTMQQAAWQETVKPHHHHIVSLLPWPCQYLPHIGVCESINRGFLTLNWTPWTHNFIFTSLIQGYSASDYHLNYNLNGFIFLHFSLSLSSLLYVLHVHFQIDRRRSTIVSRQLFYGNRKKR